MGHWMCLRVELFHQMAQEWVLLQPMAVNQALCLNKKGETHAFVIAPETGLALYPSARVRTLNGQLSKISIQFTATRFITTLYLKVRLG